MKKAVLLSLAGAGLISLSANAQITISQTNFGYTPTIQEISKIVSVGTLPQFTTGTDKQWDYSGLKDTAGMVFKRDWVAGTNSFFGTNTRKIQVARQITSGMTLPYNYYQVFETSGLYLGGIELEQRKAFPLGGMTMNPNDSLVFEKQNISYSANTKRYVVKLPMTMGDSWNAEDSADLNFTMTITNFGMNKTPGIVRSYYTGNDEVVGWGKMRIPSKTAGTPSEWLDVLVVKHHEKWVDRVFLGGRPASSQMLSMFGMQQDAVTEVNEYYVYRAGTTNPLIWVGMSRDWTSTEDMGFDPNLTATGIADTRNNTVSMSVYPNPVNGTALNMQFEKTDAGRWTIQITDAAGRAVKTETVNGIGAQNIQLNLSELSSGLYFYNLKNSSGAVLNTGKLMMNQ